MKHLLRDCVNVSDNDPTGLLVGWDDVTMLSALANEMGLGVMSEIAGAQLLVRAIARGYFTVVREYEQTFNGLDITLSPSQWEEWTESGVTPDMEVRLEAIRNLRERIEKLEKSVESMLR